MVRKGPSSPASPPAPPVPDTPIVPAKRARIAPPSPATATSALERLPEALWAPLVAALGVEATVRAVSAVSRSLFALLSSRPVAYSHSSLRLTTALCVAAASEAAFNSPTTAAASTSTTHTAAGELCARRLALPELFSQVRAIVVPSDAFHPPHIAAAHNAGLRAILLRCAPRSASLSLPYTAPAIHRDHPDGNGHRLWQPLPPALLGSTTDAAASVGQWSHCLTELSLRWDEEDGQDGGSGLLLTPPLRYSQLRTLQLAGVTLSAAQLRGFFSASCFPQLTELDVSGCSASELPAIHATADGQAVRAQLIKLRLPSRGKPLSGDEFCWSLLTPPQSQPTQSTAGGLLRELTLRASIHGRSLALLCSGLPSVELLDLSSSRFDCCYWVAHCAEALRRPAPVGAAAPQPIRPRSLRVLNWSSSLEPCSCRSHFGPAPNNAALGDDMLADFNPEVLRRRKERDAAISNINTTALQAVLAQLSDKLTSFSFQFGRTCQWDATVSTALRRLTGLRSLVLRFPIMYGDEEDTIEPADDVITQHWPGDTATPFSHLLELQLDHFPFGAAALHALLQPMGNLRRVAMYADDFRRGGFLSRLLLLGHHCPTLQELSVTLCGCQAPFNVQLSAWQRVAVDYPFLFPAQRQHEGQGAAESFPAVAAPLFQRLQSLELRPLQSCRLPFDEAGFIHLATSLLAPAASLRWLSLGFDIPDAAVLSLRHLPALAHLHFGAAAGGHAAAAYLSGNPSREAGHRIQWCVFGSQHMPPLDRPTGFASELTAASNRQPFRSSNEKALRATLTAYFVELDASMQRARTEDAN